MTARFTLMALISKVYETGLLAYLWAQTQVAYAGRGTDCVPASCSTFPDWNASSLLNHCARICIASNIRFCKWRWCCLTLHFSSTNHFPEHICAVIKRTGLLVEIIIKKLDNVKIRLFHISIQCYLFWKSDEKWVWFLKPVQAGWHAHLKHFSTTGSQRRVLHINCTCIMSSFFCSHGTYGVTHCPCTHFLKAEAAGRLRLYGGAGCSPLPHDGSSSDGLCVCLTRPVWEDMMCGSEDIYSSTSACINSWLFLKVPEIKR